MSDSIFDQFRKASSAYPNNLALRFEKKTYSYRKLEANIYSCIERLNSLHIKKGDIITVSLPNCPISVHLFYAINALGAISYNIHPLTKPNQLYGMMKQANSRILFTLSLNREEFEKDKPDEITLILVNPYYRENLLKYHVVRKRSGNPKAAIPYENLPKRKNPIINHPEEKEDAVYLNTGGTNGDPKIVRLSNESINYLAIQGYPLINKRREDIKILTAIPLFHGFGLGMGVHTPLSSGLSTVLMLKFNTKEAISHIRKGNATVILGVPALYNALLSKKSFYGPFLKKQIIAYIGGDNVPQSLLDRWNRAMMENGSDARLYEGYGLTETVTCCTVNTLNGRNRKGSIGHPLPGIEIKIISPDTREELRPKETGEILVSGPTLMNGYLNEEKLTEEVLINRSGKIYLSTKDMGYVDEDGYLYFRQRMRRIVKINGESLCPSDVENLVSRIPDVYEVYCYGEKDEMKGHHFRLAVSRKEGTLKNDEEIKKEILDLIASSLPPSYLPKEIDLYEKLPHTPVGKIDTAKFPS